MVGKKADPDGACIVAGTESGRVVLFGVPASNCNVDEAAPPRECISAKHRGPVLCIAGLISSNVFVTGGDDFEIRVWAAPIGEALRTLQGHASEVLFLAPLTVTAFSSASRDGHIKIWKADGSFMESVQTFITRPGPSGRIGGSTPLSPSHSGDSGRDTAIAALVFRSPYTIATSCRGETDVCLWRVDTGRCEGRLVGHKSYVGAMVALPVVSNSRCILTCGATDALVKVWQCDDRQCCVFTFAFAAATPHVKTPSASRPSESAATAAGAGKKAPPLASAGEPGGYDNRTAQSLRFSCATGVVHSGVQQGARGRYCEVALGDADGAVRVLGIAMQPVRTGAGHLKAAAGSNAAASVLTSGSDATASASLRAGAGAAGGARRAGDWGSDAVVRSPVSPSSGLAMIDMTPQSRLTAMMDAMDREVAGVGPPVGSGGARGGHGTASTAGQRGVGDDRDDQLPLPPTVTVHVVQRSTLQGRHGITSVVADAPDILSVSAEEKWVRVWRPD